MKRKERIWTYSMPQEAKIGPMSGDYRESDFSLIGLHLMKAVSLIIGGTKRKSREELRWQRSRTGRTLSPPQIHQKNI